MADEQAVSSPAEVDVNEQELSFEEFSRYRRDGEIPARFKNTEPAESEPADAPEKTVEEAEPEEAEAALESDPEKAQEPPQKGSGAEKRIKQLLARVKELEQRTAAKPDVKVESSTAPQPNSKPTADDKDANGNPKYSTYEDFVEALADWKSEQKVQEYERKKAEEAALNALKVKLDEARVRYEDADEVIFPAAQTIKDAQIPQAVKDVFALSDVFPDLCYVVGSDPEELQKFVTLAQKDPRSALAKVFEYEREIKAELAKPKEEPARGEDGKFKSAPEVKKTQAPKPPSPVGGGSSRAFDVSDESLSADEWARKRNEQLRRHGKA